MKILGSMLAVFVIAVGALMVMWVLWTHSLGSPEPNEPANHQHTYLTCEPSPLSYCKVPEYAP